MYTPPFRGPLNATSEAREEGVLFILLFSCGSPLRHGFDHEIEKREIP